MVLSEIITTGMNNPECSFFVGTFMGQIVSFKYVLFVAFVYLGTKIVDKLCLEPLISKIKNKIKNRHGTKN